jgi:hypothetical protein
MTETIIKVGGNLWLASREEIFCFFDDEGFDVAISNQGILTHISNIYVKQKTILANRVNPEWHWKKSRQIRPDISVFIAKESEEDIMAKIKSLGLEINYEAIDQF